MPVINRIAAYAEDMTQWRRHLHAHPELMFDCHQTAAFVVERLRDFGIDQIHEGIAQTGVVAIIEGRGGPGPTIGLRADMDALPIHEETGAPHASTVAGKMHACGHDGHTTMLLGAARYLAETRNFSGRVALIFQPAEENGAGAGVMVDEGIMDRFEIARVFGMHNTPAEPEGHILSTPGPIMAAADTFTVHIDGQGGHGAYPHETADPIPPALAMAQAFQTIVSRNQPFDRDLVISVTQIHAGAIDNVVPATAYLNGTIRSFDTDTQDLVRRRMEEIVAGQAAAYGVTARLEYDYGYPATLNHADEVAFAMDVARELVGEDRVNPARAREMASEDFAYMLQARPGAYLFVGAGPGPGLHHPAYDFNDAIAPLGASLYARLVETAQPI